MAISKESAPDSEEQKFRIKCHDLRKRISEVEESNELASLALSRTRTSIRRLRLEYAVLLERLESHVVRLSQDHQGKTHEEMARPYSPVLTDESLDFKSVKPKHGKKKPMSAAALRKAARDPNLPKRPTNAYLMFCDREKERVRTELERENPGKPVTELTRVLTEMWKGLTDEEKVPYLRLYEEDRDRYHREMTVYNKQKHDEAAGKKVALKIRLGPVSEGVSLGAGSNSHPAGPEHGAGDASEEENLEGDDENLEGDDEKADGDEDNGVDDTENEHTLQNGPDESEIGEEEDDDGTPISAKRTSGSMEALSFESAGSDASKRQRL